jgi:hypothetical protein
MKSLLLRAVPLALCLTLSVPASTQTRPAALTVQPMQLTARQWREDLAFIVAEMKQRHPNLYHTMDRDRFDAAVADLDARIPGMQRNEIIVGFMRLAAMVGDGHTRVEPRKDPKFGFPSLPLKMYRFEDGLFIRAAAPTHASLVGAQVIAFDGVATAEAVRRASEISSRDNAMGPEVFVALFLGMPDILHALKLAPTPTAAKLTLRKAGRVWTVTVPAAQLDPLWPADTDISLMTPDGWIDARKTSRPPLWLEDPLNNHRLIELPDQHALYAQLNTVGDTKDETLAEFGRNIHSRATAANPRAIILDLRLNQGGNGNLRHLFVRELIRAEDEDTRLFVLTARGTFSASQFILNDLDRLTQAAFVGEPASSKPSSFGDSYRTTLPNSGISVRTSIKWWQEGQNFAPWTYVDVAAPLRFADYAAGHDPAVEAALSYEPQPRLADILLKTGSADIRDVLDSYLAKPLNRYGNVELYLLFAADQLIRAKRFGDALLVAALATERFPRSTDAHMLHATVAEQAGKLDLAMEAARRALAADPNNRNGRTLLERLMEKTRSGR